MLTDDLRTRFRTWLVEDGCKPGDRLPGEVELARRFGVSRSAIREVIMHFTHLGLLERVRNRGTTVCAITPERLEGDLALCFSLAGLGFADLKETRLLLETAIVPLLAMRLTPAAAERLRSLIEAMAAEPDPVRRDALDRDFHVGLLEVCANRTLALFSHVIYLLFRRHHRDRFLSDDAAAKSIADHRAILAALEAGDAEAARRILVAHITPT